MQIEYLCWLGVCHDVASRLGKQRASLPLVYVTTGVDDRNVRRMVCLNDSSVMY